MGSIRILLGGRVPSLGLPSWAWGWIPPTSHLWQAVPTAEGLGKLRGDLRIWCCGLEMLGFSMI